MYGIDLLMKEHENILAFTRHLRRTCYTYALRTLSEECKTQIDEQTGEYEKKAEQDGIQEKCLAWLEKRRCQRLGRIVT